MIVHGGYCGDRQCLLQFFSSSSLCRGTSLWFFLLISRITNLFVRYISDIKKVVRFYFIDVRIYLLDKIKISLSMKTFLKPQTTNQSFKTWPSPAGRPGTRPTRASDRSGWRKKPAQKLTRCNPVDPEDRPRTRSTQSNPGETRTINYSEREIRRDGFDG